MAKTAKASDAASPSPSVVSMGGVNSMTASRADQQAAAAKKHITKMTIERAANKGYSVTHHYDDYSSSKPHVFTRDQFHSHMAPHLRRHLNAPKEVGASGEVEKAGE